MNSRYAIVFLAGLQGAVGVALSAVAAHRVQDPALATAAHMLILHAAAAIATAAHLKRTHHRPAPASKVLIAAALLMLVGSTLFAGDIALRSFTGNRLFPMAAPLGGSGMIAGWLVLALAAALSLRQTDK